MKRLLTLFFILVACGAFLYLFFGFYVSRVEQPRYELIKKEQDISIRRYPSMVMAEVQLVGRRLKALTGGFELLSDYIFGYNKEKEKIRMTAPVFHEVHKGDLTTVIMDDDKREWTIRFVMPAEVPLKELPDPNHRKVKLVEAPPQEFVVIEFTGSNSEKNFNHHLTKLYNYIQENDLQVEGGPIYAFYNPPWVLPFLRRNEILYQLKETVRK